MTSTQSHHPPPSIPFPFPDQDSSYTVEHLLHAELSGYLSGQTGRSAKTQAEALSSYITSKASQGDDCIRGHLHSFWNIVLNAVCSMPPTHPAQSELVELVLCLPTIDTGITLEHGMRRWNVWTDMPLFEESVNELFRSTAPDDALSQSAAETARRSAWTSLNLFAASITAQSGAQYDFLQQALAACATAFEQPHSTAATFEYHLAIAAAWIGSCGELLVAGRWKEQHAKDGGEDGDDEPPELARLPPRINFPAGPLVGGTSDDFGRRRWGFWAERLRKVVNAEKEGGEGGYGAEAKEMAARTLRKMEGITGWIRS